MSSREAKKNTFRLPPLKETEPQRWERRTPGWYRFFLGDIEATVVSDGRLPCDPPDMIYTAVSKEDINRALCRNFLPTDEAFMEQNCLALRSGSKYALIDTGVGYDKVIGSEETGRLLPNLRAAGIDPADVTSIVLTHAHSDHCWGLVDEAGKLNFPNAELFIDRDEYVYWTDERRLSEEGFKGQFVRGARRNLLPYHDRLNFIVDGREVLPGISAMATPGHSLGHTSYVISSGGFDYLFTGDALHSSVLHFEFPHMQFSYDLDPVLAVQSRRRMFERAISEGMSLIGYHFPFPGLGNIRREGDAYAFVAAPFLHR